MKGSLQKQQDSNSSKTILTAINYDYINQQLPQISPKLQLPWKSLKSKLTTHGSSVFHNFIKYF